MDISPQLYMACTRSRWRIARELIEKNVGLAYTDTDGFTVLHIAVKNNCPIEIAKLLVRRGLNANLKSTGGTSLTCLHLAVEHNVSTALFQYLIDAGAKVNQSNLFKRTPLHYVDFGNMSTALFDAMLAAGADINRGDINGVTPLMKAVRGDSTKWVSILLKAGSNPLARNKENKTAMDLAKMERKFHLSAMISSAVYMVIVCAPRAVSRMGTRRAHVRVLPTDLQRRLKGFLCG